MGKGKTRRVAPKKNSQSGEQPSAAVSRPRGNNKKVHNYHRGDIEADLAALGLRVQGVAADGSCFFRSLEDQLGGAGGDFRTLRQRIVNHMKANREAFEPFVEDDEPFDHYVESMGEDGTWAGNLELQAASIELQVNICVYQAGKKPWIIKNFPDDKPMLHLSYHDGMHYNSVRRADDFSISLPPEPIVLIRDREGVGSQLHGSTTNASNDALVELSDRDVSRILESTCCEDRARAEMALRKSRGDVDAAIVELAEVLAGETTSSTAAGVFRPRPGEEGTPLEGGLDNCTSNCTSVEESISLELEVSKGGKGRRVAVHLILNGSTTTTASAAAARVKSPRRTSTSKGTRGAMPARNARCLCGSTKKYKNCCGAIARRGETGKDEETSCGANGLEMLYI